MTATLKGVVAVWAYILLLCVLPDGFMNYVAPFLLVLLLTALGAVLGLIFFKR